MKLTSYTTLIFRSLHFSIYFKFYQSISFSIIPTFTLFGEMIIKRFTLVTRKIIQSMFWSNFLVWLSITSKQMSCWYFVLRTSLFLWNIYRKKTSPQHTLCEEYVLFSQKLFLTLVSNFYKTSQEMAKRRGTLFLLSNGTLKYLSTTWNKIIWPCRVNSQTGTHPMSGSPISTLMPKHWASL